MSKVLMLAIITVLLLMLEGGMSSRTRTKRELASPLHLSGIRDPYGSYCERRGGCCPGRNDQCTVPYMDTICYCDLFCNRTIADCCPDFWNHCLGTAPPFPTSSCERNGQRFHSGATYKENCNLWAPRIYQYKATFGYNNKSGRTKRVFARSSTGQDTLRS